MDDTLKAEARRGRHDSWAVETGDYLLLDSDSNRHNYEERRLDRPLEGLELVIDRQIAELVARREADGSILERPVTFVDFGGGRGMTTIRLAAKWKEQVEAGEVVFAVTNLAYLPEPGVDADGYTGVARVFNDDKYDKGDPLQWDKQDLDFVQANQTFVDYVEADAGELIGKTIPSANGTPVPLLGGIDIIHERHVLEHPHTPDVTLAVLSKCLSPDGTLFMDTRGMNPLDLSRTVDTAEYRVDITIPAYEAAREGAFKVGMAMLRASDLRQVQDVTEGRRLYYQIFAKPQAPDYATIRAQIASLPPREPDKPPIMS